MNIAQQFLNANQLKILDQERQFIAQQIAADKHTVQSTHIGQKIFNYPAPLVLSNNLFQNIMPLFTTMQQFTINSQRDHQNLRTLVTDILKLPSTTYKARNKAVILDGVFSRAIDTFLVKNYKDSPSQQPEKAQFQDNLFFLELLSVYMTYVLDLFTAYKTLTHYGRVLLQQGHLLRLFHSQNMSLAKDVYFSAIDTFLSCYELQPTGDIITKNIEITMKTLEQIGITLQNFPQTLATRYKQLMLSLFDDGILPLNALSYLFHFPPVFTATPLVEDCFVDLLRAQISDYSSYYRTLFSQFQNTAYQDPSGNIKTVIKLIFLSHPLTKSIDGLTFKGYVIPSGFSAFSVRDELEVTNGYCDLAGMITAAGGMVLAAQEYPIGRITLTPNQCIAVLQALMCADSANSYLTFRTKFTPQFLLKPNARTEFDSVQKHLFGNQLPHYIIKAVNADIPFDLSETTRISAQKAQLPFHQEVVAF